MPRGATYSNLCVCLCVFIRLDCKLSVQARRIIHERDSTDWASSVPSPSNGFPSLGRFQNQFTIDAKLAEGGQATVYIGTKNDDRQRVVFRFPRGLCDGACSVGELDENTLMEMKSACAMSTLAIERFEQLVMLKDVKTREWPKPPYSQCIQSVSSEFSDPAFEVWDLAGKFTMAERFFIPTDVAPLTIFEKREILLRLREAVSMLADPAAQAGPCCCLEKDPSQCSLSAHNKMYSIEKSLYGNCPMGMFESPHGCAALVHHDIKFDNVLLTERNGSDGHLVTQPVIIDFGVASRCAQNSAPGFSDDWVPFWQEDALVLPTECWSYDTYAVGLAWLVTELLADLPHDRLLCNAAMRSGVKERATRNSRGRSCDLPSSFSDADWQVRQDALAPVNLLVHELRSGMLNPEVTANVNAFLSFVENFVSPKHKDLRPSKLRQLPLLMPNRSVLKDHVWPLLQECPRFPEIQRIVPKRRPDLAMVRRDGVAKQAALKCRLQAASNRLNQAVSKHENATQITLRTEEFQNACLGLEIRRLVENGTDPKLAGAMLRSGWTEPGGQGCGNKEADALVLIVSQGTREELEHFVNATVASRVGSRGRNHLDAGQLLNQRVLDGDTLLAIAARRGSLGLVKFMLEQGADPLHSISVKQGEEVMSPLPALLAAATVPGNAAVLTTLLTAWTRHLFSKTAWTRHLCAYHTAEGATFGPSIVDLVAEHGDAEMLRTVLDMLRQRLQEAPLVLEELVSGVHCRSGLAGGFGDSPAHTPLLRAAKSGRSEVCKFLLREGANATVRDKWGRTPFMLAVESRSVPTLRSIAAAWPEAVNQRSGKLGTPLHVAVLNGDASMVEALLDLGASPESRNLQRDTPLHAAVRKGDVALLPAISIIAQQPEAHMARDRLGQTPLVLAAQLCKTKIFRVVMDTAHGSAVQISDNSGFLATHAAAWDGQESCLKIAAQRISISRRTSFGGRTPLMLAAWRGNVAAVRRLISLGASALEHDSAGMPTGMYIGWHREQMSFDIKYTFGELAQVAGPAFLYERDSIGVSVFGRYVFDGDVDIVKFLMSTSKVTPPVSCESVALEVRNGISAEVVNKYIGPSAWYPAGKAFTPLMLVQYRLAALKRGKWIVQRDASYSEAGRHVGVAKKAFKGMFEELRDFLVDKGCELNMKSLHHQVYAANWLSNHSFDGLFDEY